MSRYLVTGGAGFVGSNVVDALVADGHDVTILDNLSTGCYANIAHHADRHAVRLIEGTVCDADIVAELMREADVCVHLASAVGVKLIVDRPLDALLEIVHGSDVVMRAAVQRRTRLLYASTSEVYGLNPGGALHEDSPLVIGSPFCGRWSYAIAKAFGEAAAHGYCRDRGAEIAVVRLFNAVGPRQTGTYGMVLPRFVAQALAGEPMTVYGDGSQTRCFTHVSDTVEAIVQLCEEDGAIGRVFNIGNPVPISIAALAARVAARAGSTSRVQFVPYERAYGPGFQELGRRQPDIERIHALMGWAPRRTLDDAIDDVIAYERAHSAMPARLAADAC